MKLYEYDKFPCGCYLKYYDPKEVDARIAELEKALQEKDRYISHLENKLGL